MSKLTEEELNSRLSDLDSKLLTQGVPLRLRPLQSFKAIYGAMPDSELRNALFSAIAGWFVRKYGNSAVWDGVVGRIPIIIRGEIYLVVVPYTSGDTALKLTDQIEGLPQVIVDTFTSEEFETCARTVAALSLALYKLYNLSVDDTFLDDIERGLVSRALFDLENAANTLRLSGDTQTAIFHSHAAAEKFLKVALKQSGSATDHRSLGHQLTKIFAHLVSVQGRYAWLKSSVDSLQEFAPNMEIRYGVMPRTIQNAVSAFNASLNICGMLAQMWIFDRERGTVQPTFSPGHFYIDGSGATYYCDRLSQTKTGQPGAILFRFGHFPIIGALMAEISLDLVASALYLEIKEECRIEALRKEFESAMRNRGREFKPASLGIKIASGPEGSCTTASMRIEIKKP